MIIMIIRTWILNTTVLHVYTKYDIYSVSRVNYLQNQHLLIKSLNWN